MSRLLALGSTQVHHVGLPSTLLLLLLLLLQLPGDERARHVALGSAGLHAGAPGLRDGHHVGDGLPV
jgi:hypothetical protein